MKHKKKWTTLVLILGFLVGITLAFYPAFSNFWNSNFATHAITSYVEQVSGISENDYKAIWSSAIEYNKKLSEYDGSFILPDELRDDYARNFNVMGDGLIGYIEISKIDVHLPVYHGTSDAVLQTGVGHLDWSALPTGGKGTHCALSGHRGLLNAKLFTDLDVLREGDTFVLSVLGETLTYEVDRIRTVEPTDFSELVTDPEQDYCTLITCTPYGINSHRLLVRGHRIENAAATARVVSEAIIIDNRIVALFMAVPILLLLTLLVLLKKPEKKFDKQRILSELQRR